MRFSSALSFLAPLGALILPAMADERMLKSTSLNTCQENSGFSASLFNVVYTPDNGSASVNLIASSSIEGSVIFDIAIYAYGYEIDRQVINPCDVNLVGFCPMSSGRTSNPFNIAVPPSAARQIPGIAYTFPDLDAKVRAFINRTDGSGSAACVEANISNGKTVDLVGVKWAAALVTGLVLASSAIMSGLGHSNAASHVAANALSLCGYFQAQAIIGMVSIPLPPVVQSWTQDLQWSMGIIKVDFMQDIFTWYQRATGGTPSTLLNSLTQISVQVEKRSLSLIEPALNLYRRATAMIPRDTVQHTSGLVRRDSDGTGNIVITGLERVAFRAGIETTNLFMTGIVFYCLVIFFTALAVAAWKGFCELATKAKWMKGDTFYDFRHGWRTVLKGILFRMTIIGYTPICILCIWEMTRKDSAAEIIWAIWFFFGTTITLGWAAYKVIRIAQRSVVLHKNPAYILFSDNHALNKWGFLYIQFRASAYYFIVPILGYTLVKGIFIAVASGAAQSIALIIIEAAALIAASVLRPWMDKTTNSFNIAICVVNFVNSIFVLIFTDIFDQPPLVTGVIGVVLWILNAAFTLVLLLMLIVSTVIIFFNKNPDGRYQYMGDDRTSFMKSQSQLHTTNELDALAKTARGDPTRQFGSGVDLDDDNISVSEDSMKRRMGDPSSMPLPPSTSNSATSSIPRNISPFNEKPTQFGPGYRSQNSSTPWQRGAGYDPS